jgi:cell division protein YceG involved in septum cleavage
MLYILKIFLIIFLIIFLLSYIVRILIYFLFKRLKKQFENPYQQKPEGNVTIKNGGTSNKKVDKNVGDYIDYEEVK